MNEVSSTTRSTGTAAAKAAEVGTSGNASGKALASSEGGNVLPAGVQSAAVSPAQSTPDVEAAVSRLNEYVQSVQRDLRFSVDSELGRPVVTVVDRETEEVIRQIPSEVAIRLARNLNDVLDSANPVDPAGGAKGSGTQNPIPLINTRI